MNGTDAPASRDRVKCPECGSDLRPIRTPERITVHSCPSCRTVWLDGGAIADAGWGAGLPPPLTNQPAGRSCPRCAQSLLELRYESARGSMQVDFCESCSGLRVSQAQMAALRELAATTRDAGAGSGNAAATTSAGDPGETIPAALTAPAAGEAKSRSGLLVLTLCAVVVAGGAYLLRQSGKLDTWLAGEAKEPEVVKQVKKDPGAFFTVVPALKRFYEEFSRWPTAAQELDGFARDKKLSFHASNFDSLTWREKQDGGLIIEYREKGAQTARIFHASPPAVKPQPAP